MKLEYRLALKDYLEANQIHLKSQRLVYFLIWSISILLILIGLLSLGFYIYILTRHSELVDKGDGFAYNFTSSVFLLVFGACLIPLVNLIQRYSLTRIWKTQPSIREPMTLEVTEEGFKLKSASFESNVKWQIYTHFFEATNFFMLYQSKQAFYLVPKRAFSSTDQVADFRELLSRKIVKLR